MKQDSRYGGKLYPADPDRLIEVAQFESLCDGVCDCLQAIMFEKRYRPEDKMFQGWIDRQWEKATRTLDRLETEVPDLAPDAATLALRGMLGYLSIRFEGEYAYGWLRTETGVHRLVRKSPFDSGGRRHTSFSSVFVSPEVDDDIDIEIDAGNLRVDTYRASGAGGQHVNRTDSAVRLTYLFKDDGGTEHTVVTQCQSERSQHQNKDKAMKMLQAKVYELEMQRRNAEKQALENSKADIGWGSQIRSYVLDDARIKDLRTGVENRNTQAVLDGALDPFIEASLKAGL